MNGGSTAGVPVAEGRVSPGAGLAIVIVAELVYIAGRSVVSAQFPAMIPGELALTAWRLLFVGLYVWLFRESLREAWRASSKRRVHPLLIAGAAVALFVILAAGYARSLDLGTRLVFALTTLVVALREEIVYRFVLQNALERRVHPVVAILVSSLLFVLYHVGAQPMNMFVFVSMAGASLLLGVLYQRTRSLRAVVLLHLVLDLAVLVSFPFLMPAEILLLNLGVVFLALLAWTLDRSRERAGR
jgi:membrane protease YdiL (CAAX protease family)